MTKRIYSAALFFVFSLSFGFAQTVVPSGKAILKEFTNATAHFEVPEGKYWVVYGIFSDYVSGGTIKLDQFTKTNVMENSEEVRIFMKNLNGTQVTDLSKNIFGTQLYRSTNASSVIPFPVVFPEKTSFDLLLVKGEDIASLKEHTGKGFISIMEVNNP